MGFLDKISSLFENKEEPIKKGLPFTFTTSLNPVRLNARKESSLQLSISVKNVEDKPFLASVKVEVPRALGFENVGMAKIKELRLGEIAPKSEKSAHVTICSNPTTLPGTYSVIVTVNHHYRDYEHILNYAQKTIEIRAV